MPKIKFQSLLNDLNIDETFTATKQRKLNPELYNHVKSNIPLIAN